MRTGLLFVASSTLVALAALVVPVSGFPLPIDSHPAGIGVDPVTNRVYVALSGYGLEENLAVVDVESGATLKSIRLRRGREPHGVAVDAQRNRIYVTRAGGWVTVVDGASDTVIASISVGSFPYELAVNPVTNRIYVTDGGRGRVWVIDGASLGVVTNVAVGQSPHKIDVNPATNRIYVAHTYPDAMTVIDGVTNTIVATVPLPASPWGVAVHPGTNKIYVSHTDPSQPSVTVVDGATNAVIGTIDYPEGYDLWSLSIDQSTNLLYVVEREAGLARRRLLSVIDTATDTIVGSELLAATQYNLGVEVAVNQNTHRAYAPGDCLSNVSVVYGGELLKNPSFEGVDQSEQPRSWRMRGLSLEDGTEVITCSTVNDLVFEGARSLRLAGAAGVEKEVYQNVAVAGPAGTVINLEGFSRATDASPAGGPYQIRARVSFTDGSADTFDVRFAKGTHPWRRGFQAYTAPKAFDRVRVSVVYENQTGTAWFDAVHLWTTEP